jgi:hypothetical protein
MLDIDATMTTRPNSQEGSENWTPFEAGVLSINKDVVAFGDIRIPCKEIVSAILNKFPWPHGGYSLIVNTQDESFMFGFSNPAMQDLVFPFQVERIKHNPFKQKPSKLMWGVYGVLFILLAYEFWRGFGVN